MIELRHVTRSYRLGDVTVRALDDVTLSIAPGEFVAIMGPSGSGKSTLLQTLGLLDVPDSGSYRLLGEETAGLDDDALAALRSRTIGFVFQQFHLLPRLTALQNAALPLLYASGTPDEARAAPRIADVGLGDRAHHRPNQLSGGQQQRVAIARALVNDPRLILADEPTGNLDSHSQEEILTILKALHARGITVVVVTHEEEIARIASRVIRMRDGRITADERHAASVPVTLPPPAVPVRGSVLAEWREHLRQGLRTLIANKVRAGLSMLGILVGVAAVVAMLAIGQGAKRDIEARLASLGSNLLVLRQGAVRVGGVTSEAGAATRLSPEDADAIRDRLPAVRDTGATVSGRAQAAYSNRNWSTQVLGVTPAYARMRASQPDHGRFLTEDENRRRARVAVVGRTVARELFGDQDPLGLTLKLNKISFQVIGVLPAKGATGWRDQDDVVVIPLGTAMHRLLGKDYVDYIDVEVASAGEIGATQDAIQSLMQGRKRVPASQQQGAFDIRNLADIQAALSETSRTMSWLLASVAAISLLVGGIGIMNIMLVSVTERTREIGLRKAIGARSRDIERQFLVETLVITLVGGLAGLVLGVMIATLLAMLAGWVTVVTPSAVLLAVMFSVVTGLVFGLYPARKAAALNPIAALRYE